MDKIVKKYIEQTKGRSNNPFGGYAKTIMKFDRNRLFKGHLGSISYGAYEDKTSYLTIMNQYYDAWIYFSYNFESNKSEISITVHALPTKYMEAFYKKVTHNGKYNLQNQSPTGIYENKSELHIDQMGGVSITNTLFYDEFVALGHFENIKIVEEARIHMKRFKSIIRENGNSKEFCKKISFIKDDDVFIAESLYT